MYTYRPIALGCTWSCSTHTSSAIANAPVHMPRLTQDDGYWEGMMGDKQGLFPGNFVKPIEYVSECSV